MMIFPASFICLVLFPTIIHSLSVCDELDIAFLATPDSIIDSLDSMKRIMDRVMNEGTSDSADYNLMLYGDNVPLAFQNTIIPIFNPSVLNDLQSNLLQNADSTTASSEITVSDAIRVCKHQDTTHYKPYLKQQRFREFSDHNYTATQYIVFADDISNIDCDKKDDEINAILKDDTPAAVHDNIDTKCTVNVFSEYNLIHSLKQDTMRLDSTTCNAKVLDDDRNEILLNHNAQFVDADSYIKCNIVFDDTHSRRLDSNKSYIYAINGMDEFTKYNVNDYLIVTRDEVNDLPKSCKGALVYRIKNISTVSVQEIDFEGIDVNDSANVLRLSIESPRTMHEYIFVANIKKDERVEPEEQEWSRRRRMFVDADTDLNVNDLLSDIDSVLYWEKTSTYTPASGIDISYTLSFGIDINVFFSLSWDIFSGNQELEFRIYGEYSAGFVFEVTVENTISISIPDFVNFVPDSMVIWAGLIPIWAKPYLKASTDLTVLAPVAVSSTLQCTHTESYNVGYKFSKENIYTPAYGLIASDYYLYKFPIEYDFGTGHSLTSCAQANYLYDGVGELCDYWSFKAYDGSCHCISASWSDGDAKPTTGWDLYKLGADCFSITTTCESDSTGCNSITGYQLHVYTNQDCSDECYWFDTCSMYTCGNCDPWSTNDKTDEKLYEETISETNTKSNTCQRTYSLKENRNDDLCDTLMYDDQIGFDLTIEPVIGVVLYDILDVYARIPILNEFRMQPIETNPSICSLSTNQDMCGPDSNTIYVSFKITTSWSLYLGAVISIENAVEAAMNALVDDPKTSYAQSIQSNIGDVSGEISIFEDVDILSGYFACKQMVYLSSSLNSYLLNRCCGVSNTAINITTPSNTASATSNSTSTTSTNGWWYHYFGLNTTSGSDPMTEWYNLLNANGCNVTMLEYVHDGYCDAYGGYNTQECLYDGGDCCEQTCSNSSTYTCGNSGYQCLDPSVIANNTYNFNDTFGFNNTYGFNDTSGFNVTYGTTPAWYNLLKMNGCNVTRLDYIHDGYCDVYANSTSNYNTAECLYDGGDCCRETCVNSSSICGVNGYQCLDPSVTANDTSGRNDTRQAWYNLLTMNGCNVTYLDYINDAFCDDGDYNTKECFYDGGDCCQETCRNSSILSCGIAGYHCLDPSVIGNDTSGSNDTSQDNGTEWYNILMANGCNVAYLDFIHDGYCDHDDYNTKECFYDGGDCCQETCQNSSTYICGIAGYNCLDVSVIGNNTFDFNDTSWSGYNTTYGTTPAWYNVLIMNGCNVTNIGYINDAYCDKYGGYNTQECFYDGGDCCQQTCANSSSSCGVNGYQCIDPSVIVNDTYQFNVTSEDNTTEWYNLLRTNGCNVEYLDFINNGYCDVYANGSSNYNTEECFYDGGDCCEETCRNSSMHSCGSNGYYCLDPSVTLSNTVIATTTMNTVTASNTETDGENPLTTSVVIGENPSTTSVVIEVSDAIGDDDDVGNSNFGSRVPVNLGISLIGFCICTVFVFP